MNARKQSELKWTKRRLQIMSSKRRLVDRTIAEHFVEKEPIS